jgi:hypothetical protein
MVKFYKAYARQGGGRGAFLIYLNPEMVSAVRIDGPNNDGTYWVVLDYVGGSVIVDECPDYVEARYSQKRHTEALEAMRDG